MLTVLTSAVSATSATQTQASRATGAADASVALQAKLSRCEQQLGDWQACPSRKTPEGKKIIQDLQTQIRNLESRIGSSGRASGSPPRAADVHTAQAAAAPGTGASPSLTLGRFVDVLA